MQSNENLLGMLIAGRYQILDILGHGGMGEVYQCRDQKTGELYAIKLLHSHLLMDPQALKRFHQEAEAASRILHPNAIVVVDIGDAPDGRPYIVTEFVDGVSLAEHLVHVGRLNISEATAIFVQICNALVVAHRYGVVHRDIKPSNIMLRGEGNGPFEVKVVDFGIAKLLPREGDGTFVETGTGKLIGSPPYMSPEQCLGERIDSRSDIYSMGCVMYECIVGSPPFIGNSPMETMYRHLHDAHAPLTGLPEDIRLVQRFDQIITRALQKSPANRYQTVAELKKDLDLSIQYTAKKLRPVAFLELYLQGFFRKYVSAVGSSRFVVICITMSTLAVSAISSCFLIPYVVTHGPTQAQKKIDWQVLPPPSSASGDLNLATTKRRDALTAEIEKFSRSEGSVNPDSIFLNDKLANLYFDDECYNSASAYYGVVLEFSEKLYGKTYSTYQATPAVVHNIAKASERLAQCELRLARYKRALEFAQSGLKWAFSDTNSDDSYKAYFCAIQGVATAKLGGPDTTINENCDNFIQYVKMRGLKSIDVRKAAWALSDIADCDLESGKWARALKVLDMAREAWSLVEFDESKAASHAFEQYLRESHIVRHTGLFNEAVADFKKANAFQHLGQSEEALRQFEKTAEEFESVGGKNDFNRAKVLFREADYLWSGQQFIKSWLVRVEAVKIWSGGKHSENRRQVM